MGIIMYDSVNPGAIPADAALVASYVDGFGGYSAAVNRFGVHKVVSISIHGNVANVADVENGAMTPGMLPAWIDAAHARGVARPGVYCNLSTWPTVQSHVAGRKVSYWIADWRGTPFTLAGADAVQYVSTNAWDASWVLSSFPWFPGGVTPPVTDPTLKKGAKGDAVKTLQTRLNVHGANIAVDGDFGNKTFAAVEGFQKAAKLFVDGVVGPQTWQALNAKPTAITRGMVTFGTPPKSLNVKSTDQKTWTVG